jgi:predicted methyltransferase
MSAAPERTVVTDDTQRASANADDRVELALDLLAALEHDALPLSATVDRIETVTTDPTLVRAILDEAELRGLIERDDGRVRMRREGGSFVRFERQVVEREGDFDCRRCGAPLSTGHFVQFESGELGPFGSSCVRKVLGRD